MDRATTTEPRRPPPGPHPPAPPSRVAGVVGLLVLVTVATALAGPWDPQLSDPGFRGPSDIPPELLTAPPLPDPPPLADLEPLASQPWDLTWLGFLLLATLGIWLVYLVLRWLQRHPFPRIGGLPDDGGITPGETLSEPLQPDLPSLRQGVSDADDELRARRTPTDAVIAAWVALEAAAARSGVVRDPASTPTEFTVAVLDATPADPSATRSLLALYLRARFGGEYMREGDVAAATSALRALARGLGTDPP